jgi:hypothetical protein
MQTQQSDTEIKIEKDGRKPSFSISVLWHYNISACRETAKNSKKLLSQLKQKDKFYLRIR